MRMTSFFSKEAYDQNFLEDWGCFVFAPKPWNLGLQEFTCFNDLDRKQLYLAGPLDGCQVLLQNLVASEEEIGRAPPMTPAWIQLKQASEQGAVGPILFEGSETAGPDRVPPAEPMEHRDFWHHMVFDMAHGRASPSGGLETTQGEFWMSKRAMNMHPVYLYCVLAEMTPCPRHMYHKTIT
eukprot:symbB.v1.2.014842.t1/scaffold1085.1/size139158/16